MCPAAVIRNVMKFRSFFNRSSLRSFFFTRFGKSPRRLGNGAQTKLKPLVHCISPVIQERSNLPSQKFRARASYHIISSWWLTLDPRLRFLPLPLVVYSKGANGRGRQAFVKNLTGKPVLPIPLSLQGKPHTPGTCNRRSQLSWQDASLPLKGLTPVLQGSQLMVINYFLQLKIADKFKARVQLYIATQSANKHA